MKPSAAHEIVSPQLDRGQLKLKRVPALAPLTTFRFFAAAAIVCYHAAFLQLGYLASGVGFFFVLSGFILTYVHPALGQVAPYRLRDYGGFWASRLGRVWPLHVITLIYVLIVHPYGVLLAKLPVVGFSLNFFLLQSWIPIWRVSNSFNGVSWSLSDEAFFYAIFPFVLPWVTKAPVKMVVASFILVLFLTFAAAWILPEQATVHEPSYSVFVLFTPIMNVHKFILGMALAVGWMNARKTFRAPSHWSWVELFCLIGVLLFYPLSSAIANFVTGGSNRFQASVHLQDTLCLPFAGMLIWVFAFQAGRVSRFLSQTWLVFLGEISFAIYMVHNIILVHFGVTASLHLTAAHVLPFAATLLVISTLLYLFVERPARKWIIRTADRILSRPKSIPA